MTDAALLVPLPRLMVEPIVRAALLEDLGRAGDLTTDAIVPAGLTMNAVIAARQEGVISGVDTAVIAFGLIDPAVAVTVERGDGARVAPGDVVIRLEGPARAIITAERVALNLLCRMSGVATATAGLVAAARPHGKARIVCTRKTTPGLRALEKHAVRAGGGSNHRFGLDDAVLIKDNHVAVAGGVGEAVARAVAAGIASIIVEVDRLDQIAPALDAGATHLLLDNMDAETLRAAVAAVAGRVPTEASGGVRLDTIRSIAETGVTYISVGRLTQSAPAVDIGLDFAAEPPRG